MSKPTDPQSEFERRLAEDRKRIQELQAERAAEEAAKRAKQAAEEAAKRAEKQRKAQEALEMLQAKAKEQEIAQRQAERASLPPVYTVQQGDTLSAIALKYYGNAALWTEIYKANKHVIGDDPAKIFPGQELKIPKLG